MGSRGTGFGPKASFKITSYYRLFEELQTLAVSARGAYREFRRVVKQTLSV